MAQLPNLTFTAPGYPLYGQGGSPNLDISTLTLVAGNYSTILETFPGAGQLTTYSSGTLIGQVRMDDVLKGVLITDGLGTESQFEGTYFNTANISCASISTNQVDLDGQTLNATATELLLNGIPIATTANLSSIQDWALYPAVSTVQMANYPLIDVGGIAFKTGTAAVGMSLSEQNSSFNIFYEQPNILQSQITMSKNGIAFSDSQAGGTDLLISTQNVYAFGNISAPSITVGSGVFNDISTITLTAFSTIHNISTVSSLVLEGQLGVFSTLVGGNISTPSLTVSSINGAEFTSTSITVEVAGVSSLVANSISSIGAELRTALVSTLQFNPSFSPNLDVNLGLGSLFGNLAGAAAGGIGVLVGAAGLGTGIAALAQGRQTNNINSNAYELVNGTTQLQVSTLGTGFTTIYRYVSSVSDTTPGEEIFISTVNPPGLAIRSISDPLNTVSAPTSTIQSFGQWVALPGGVTSTVSTFQQLYTSSLNASTVSFNNDTLFRNGAGFGGTAGVSTTELFWSGASPPLDANLRVGQIILSGDDVGGLNYSKDVLIANQNAGNRLSVYGAGGVGPSTIAYLSDLPSTVSTFKTLQTSTLNLSTMYAEGQMVINPSTLRSGIWMPQDATNGTGVIAISLSTSATLYENYSFFGGGFGNAVGSAGAIPMMNILGTNDNEVTFKFADLILGRVLVQGNIDYGLNPCGYLTGDAAGNLTLVSPTVAASSNLTASTITARAATVSTLVFTGVSTCALSTVGTAGTQGQPAGRLTFGNVDLDLQQNDLWVQQLRVGAGNATNSQSEIIFYDAAAGVKGLNTALQDRTIRVISTINGTTGGYLLDTAINAPFFSTLAGTSTALMAFFPSTTNSTIGVSTISVMPPLNYFASVYSSTSQTVAAANTSTLKTYNATAVNVGGFTVNASSVAVPVAGTYEVNASFQFATTSGGANLAEFWLVKNGAAVPQTNSRVTVANNADNLGTVSIFDTAAAGDTYGWMFYSSDANMTANAVAAGATPAIPSLIFNVKRLG